MLTLKQSRRLRNALLGLLCWGIALLLFFPIFWMLLTSFKSEIDAFATPPQFIFQPTLENYLHINERSDYFAYAWNSLLISSSATLLCMLVAVPAAYSMAFFETRHTRRTLLCSKQRAWTAPAPGRRSSAYCCRSPAAGSPRPCCCR